jgi:hypothetical protein
MDEPRLKIFRFKHLKTSLEEEREKFVNIMQSDGKSSLERRAGSKKAANRYETKTEESDSFERMSHLEGEHLFEKAQHASPKLETTRELYNREIKQH